MKTFGPATVLGLVTGFVLAFGLVAIAVTLVSPGRPAPEEQVARGARLYATYCISCHGDKDGTGRQPGAPSHGPDGHTWHHSDRNLKEIVLNGAGEMGEMMRQMMGIPEDAPRMPAWKGTLSEEEVGAVLAYIKTFWTPEQRRFQQETPMMP